MHNNNTNQYELILFDLGNTIFHIDFDKSFQYWSQISGIALETIRERFQWDDAHKAFERGHLSEEAYTQHLGSRLGFDLSYKDFFKGWNAIYLENLAGIEILLAGLSKDYKLAALSNTNVTHEKVWKGQYKDLLSPLEKVFGSHHLGAVKPEKIIYEKALSILDVTGEKTIFLDDKIENIEGAAQVGITGIVVESPKQMYDALNGLGVLNKKLYKDLLTSL